MEHMSDPPTDEKHKPIIRNIAKAQQQETTKISVRPFLYRAEAIQEHITYFIVRYSTSTQQREIQGLR